MSNSFKPYVPAEQNVAELTIKSILLGCFFGIVFGCSTTYLAIKAGLTVTASIPIAVIAITLGRKLFKTTILENNIIQTTGSAGESIAAGVAFTLPGFLFLSADESGNINSAEYFNYFTIFSLAALGGMLGTMMMIPLRRSLIVKEHGVLPYPEGTACASVLQAGEKGGVFAQTAFVGMGVAFAYAILQKVFHVIAETPSFVTKQVNKFWPSATINGEITPEYLGVGYIIGPKISGVLVAGSVLAWWAIIPLLATLVPFENIAHQLVTLGYLKDISTAGGRGNWDPVAKTFANPATALYFAYIRQIGAGAVAAGGFITLLKTIPTIVNSFRESMGSLKDKSDVGVSRTERDLSFKVVIIGSLLLVLIISILPKIPGDSIIQKLLLGVLVIIFGFFFVTVASRIVGLVGTSNSPISGMTIATLMGTCLIFTSVGWSGRVYEPMALVVGGIICIAAANAGGTSQDLKTGFLIGATPKYQQIALFIGALVSSVAIGVIIKILDTPTQDLVQQGFTHAIGSTKYPAPQATLMATLTKGILSFNLDWQYVMVGVFIAVMIELCGIKALAFAIGLYLPLATTLPIFIGGALKGMVDWRAEKRNEKKDEDDLSRGNLFATGLIAGGAISGVVVAVLSVFYFETLQSISVEHSLSAMMGENGYMIFGSLCFFAMAAVLVRTATKK
ncbi:MAG: oligopeptide transporter, OPT family [Cytophagales bacterium]|jgi:putative OPT family oligopeptide transporter|nr:oligopeptide transporter, OPT family [Bacteroidota bacterium]MBS1981307.1 oligopeptide transporter, OPT family [Bacteroidota bacterium]WHZ09326.1 MAG: oligopeptide transporter, OPT family [Cytophagales bacterium]